MSKLKALIVIGFLVVFASGAAVGRIQWTTAPQHKPSWLKEELGLSEDQSDKMNKIWSEASAARGELRQKFQTIDKERDDAVIALFDADQKVRYEAILRNHKSEADATHQEVQKIMHDAEERTRQILTDPQRKKFDEIIKEHGHHGPGRFGQRRGEGATTKP